MPPDLAAWVASGAVTAAVEGVMVRRRYTGRLGLQVRGECRAAVAAAGGPGRAAAVLLARDLLMPPLGMMLCAVKYWRDRGRP